jgi:integrase
MARSRYPTIKQGNDGLWHAWITVGTKGNGRPDQRHVKRSTRSAVEDRIDELLDQRRSGAVVKAGRGTTAAQWLGTYLDTVLPSSGRCDPGTIRDYRSKIEHWVLPVIGRIRVDRIKTEHLEEIYLRMRRAGRADSTVLKVHRILSRAFEIARRRRLVAHNVAKDMDAPTFDAADVAPLTQEDAAAVLAAAAGQRNSARWSVALALGLRQGEVLGLRWAFVDLDGGEVRVWWQLRRRAFEHGCGGACGKRRGGNCPARVMPLRTGEVNILDLSKPADADRRTGFVLKRPKGKGKRQVPIPEELVAELRRHLAAQQIERALAGPLWQDHGLVFCEPDGRPIDPARDHAEWKAILAGAGVPAARLHDGRHTAATIMIFLGVPVEVVQEILGHSDVRTTRGYTHVASEMAKSATARMGRALLKSSDRAEVHPAVHP